MDNLQKMKVFYVQAILAVAQGNPIPHGVSEEDHAKRIASLAWELAEVVAAQDCTDYVLPVKS